MIPAVMLFFRGLTLSKPVMLLGVVFFVLVLFFSGLTIYKHNVTNNVLQSIEAERIKNELEVTKRANEELLNVEKDGLLRQSIINKTLRDMKENETDINDPAFISGLRGVLSNP